MPALVNPTVKKVLWVIGIVPVLVTVLAAVEPQAEIRLFHSPGPNASVIGPAGVIAPRQIVVPPPATSNVPDTTEVVSNWMSSTASVAACRIVAGHVPATRSKVPVVARTVPVLSTRTLLVPMNAVPVPVALSNVPEFTNRSTATPEVPHMSELSVIFHVPLLVIDPPSTIVTRVVA